MSTLRRPPVSHRLARFVLALIVGALLWAGGQQHILYPGSGRSFGKDFVEGMVLMLVVLALTPLVASGVGMWKARRSRS